MKEKKQENLGIDDERFQKLMKDFDLDSILNNKENEKKEEEKR